MYIYIFLINVVSFLSRYERMKLDKLNLKCKYFIMLLYKRNDFAIDTK